MKIRIEIELDVLPYQDRYGDMHSEQEAIDMARCVIEEGFYDYHKNGWLRIRGEAL